MWRREQIFYTISFAGVISINCDEHFFLHHTTVFIDASRTTSHVRISPDLHSLHSCLQAPERIIHLRSRVMCILPTTHWATSGYSSWKTHLLNLKWAHYRHGGCFSSVRLPQILTFSFYLFPSHWIAWRLSVKGIRICRWFYRTVHSAQCFFVIFFPTTYWMGSPILSHLAPIGAEVTKCHGIHGSHQGHLRRRGHSFPSSGESATHHNEIPQVSASGDLPKKSNLPVVTQAAPCWTAWHEAGDRIQWWSCYWVPLPARAASCVVHIVIANNWESTGYGALDPLNIVYISTKSLP